MRLAVSAVIFGGVIVVFHWTSCSEPTFQIVPFFGLTHDGKITTGPGPPLKGWYPLWLLMAPSAFGNAVAEETMARTERRAVKGCITEVAEETTTMQVWGN
jgi:hypothetical protein